MRTRLPAVVLAWVLLGAAVALLQACSGGPSPDADGPPRGSSIPPIPPDAVPRVEPRSRYGNPDSYVVYGRRYHVLQSADGYVERGIASWYGRKFHGRRTSSGEPYDMNAMTAAHKSLPLPSYVRVTNLENGRSAVLRVNDRGPFHDNRIIDLSYAAARKLGILGEGTGLVEVRAIVPGHTPAPRLVPVSTVPPEAAPAPRAPRLFLQAGAFADPVNAERVRARLEAFPEAVVEVNEVAVQGQRLFRVRIGPLSGVAQADRLSAAIEAAGMDLPHIVIE